MIDLTIVGNLTADPVIREVEWTNTETGEILKDKVCNFTVAADDGYGAKKKVQFFKVSVWRKPGETCYNILNKGRQVLVKGPVFQNTYKDASNVEHTIMQIRGERVEFLTGGTRVTVNNDVIVEEIENEETPY